ncbi:uncharacterized protein MELLADRAFT_107990 [Melampsora larici-populina 98AG31]|uniref:Secreted protein n=1 Tax=Melampsora larici-populina (strain 98AG31 / pathotype 3-4-7) TaxID=747676 RepID=F4RRL6_MELLP|nr:uncharacterized protein MELLADRAFT_107990 [Melampsora larici-populina 98AG31]EGG05000.1 secreted protein [Melampsora larici-populina 98AG31]
MSSISKSWIINLTILFAFLTTLVWAEICQVCMYDGTIYRDWRGEIAAPKFCDQKATEMSIINQNTNKAMCTYMNWNTNVKDQYGQKTFCRIKCERPTHCIGTKSRIKDKDGNMVDHLAFLGRMDMQCNEWPAK